MVAVVGTDFTSTDRAPFVKRGVDLSGLEVKEGKTFHWGGSYDKDFNTAVTKFTDLNVFQNFNPVLTDEQKMPRLCFSQYWPGTPTVCFKAGQAPAFGGVRYDELLDFV